MRIPLKLRLVSLGLAALWVLPAARTAMGQETTNIPALMKLAEETHLRTTRERAQAWVIASLFGIPVRKTVGGSTMELMRFSGTEPLYRATCNLEAAETIGADQLWPGGSLGLSLNGAGVPLGQWDDGLPRFTHQEFGGRASVVPGDTGTLHSSHPTRVAGTMIAAGTVADAKGMSFGGSLQSGDFNFDIQEMTTLAAAGLRASNHSYVVTGPNWLYGFYLSNCVDWDTLAYNAPYYLMVEASGNSQGENGQGPYDTVWPMGTSKDNLTVGAVQPILGGYQGNPSSISLASFSSCGPTQDGRIKPDVVGCGEDVYTTDSASDTAYYAYFTGTSVACPNISGAMGLLIQHFRNLHEGSDMRSATLKGLVIHTADHPNTPAPDYELGWGLVNCKTAANVISNQVASPVMIQERTLSSGQTYSFRVGSLGTQPLKVTISWTDPAGVEPTEGIVAPFSTLELVNDLDLRIANGGTTYYPWVLDPTHPSAVATTGDNFRDNVEQVYIAAPAAGVYTITVSHKGTTLLPSGTQAFSVIVTGQSPFVEGAAVLQDYLGDPTTVPLTVDLRTPGTTTALETHVVSVDGSGNFMFPTALSGSYDVACKGSHWLRSVAKSVAVSDSAVAPLSFSLINGDVNGDNNINLADLLAISAAWRTNPGDPKYNPNADLNGDGSINLADWLIVSKNWRKIGSP